MTATSTSTPCPEPSPRWLAAFLLLMLACTACKSPWPTVRSQFPEYQQDTLHLASWPSRSSDPEFTDHLSKDSSLADALGMDVETFKPHARLRLDAAHELYIAEGFMGISGTTFQLYLAEAGVDTLAYASLPNAEALYADEPVSSIGDVAIANQSDQAWLIDLDRDNDIDYVYSSWSYECTVVSTRVVPGDGESGEPEVLFEEECDETSGLTCYFWDGNAFQKGECPEGSDFKRLRLVHEED